MTIKEMPVYADAWMRRGQARAAMGEDEDALQDFEQCLKLTSEPARKVSQGCPSCMCICNEITPSPEQTACKAAIMPLGNAHTPSETAMQGIGTSCSDAGSTSMVAVSVGLRL